MRQKETTATTRFSLLPGSITRFFLLLIIVLLVTMGVMVQSAVNAWLKDKSYQIVDITHAIQKRVDNWRYVTWQIYDNIAATTSPSSGEGLQETRLKQDVYYLEKPRRKTEALIFGSHDNSTLEMTQRMSTYLDTLWGAENVPWSMYYLNGQDNSLVLISTLPLKISPPDLKNRPSATLLIHVVQRCCNRPTPSMNAKAFLTCAAWPGRTVITLHCVLPLTSQDIWQRSWLLICRLMI
ncbi:two-component system sensor kinase [Escherichia coli]|nr:two-component system sensor kinase [Escherichia coli]